MNLNNSTKLNSLSLNCIEIKDEFWTKYTRLVKDVIIPYQWDILNDRIEDAEPSHCLNNFRIAAGEKEGEFGGAVFQDTDVAKWLEAVAFTLSSNKDEALEKIADDVIDLIGRAQDKDGYINTYFTIKEPDLRWTNLTEGHELYTAGHLIEAAVAYYNATGKEKFLKIMIKFADLICNTFGNNENQHHGYPGHQEIELALVKLYEVTKNRRYLDTAKYFIDERGKSPNYFLEERKTKKYKEIFPEFKNYLPLYSQSHKPVREQTTAEGHAVRAVYMYCAMADIAYEYKDEELLKACKTLWNNIINKRMYITGGIGSSGIMERFTTDYDLPNEINYSETCASIGLALFGLRMTKITKEAHYMDIVEKALYNTVLAGISMNGKEFFYVNPLEVWPDACIERTTKEHVKAARQKWFGVACCPPNIARTLASLGQYIYLIEMNKIYINLFISNKTKVEINNKKVNLKLETHFPNENKINISIASELDEEITLAIRIPAYAENYSVMVNDNESYEFKTQDGYALINGKFNNDKIIINFESPARFIYSNPFVRADSGKVAVVKGPLLYCLEEIDNCDNLSAVFVDTSTAPTFEYDKNLFDGTTVLTLKGRRISGMNWKEDELYGTQKPIYENAVLKAIPYCYWGNRGLGEMIVWMKYSN